MSPKTMGNDAEMYSKAHIDELATQLRPVLIAVAATGKPITYREATRALALKPPNTIHRTTQALETLIAEDAAAGRPLLAALVISRNREGLPAPGFFDCAAAHGRFGNKADGGETAQSFYQRELEAAIAFYGGT